MGKYGSHIKLREIVRHDNVSDKKTAGKIRYYSWGDDDKYPYFIEYLRQNSSLHGGIINGKVLRLIGKEQLFNRDISNGVMPHNLKELIRLCAEDFEVYNCFAVVVKSVGGNNYYKHIPIKNCRYSEDGKYILVSSDWTKKKGVKVYGNYFNKPAEDLDLIAIYGFSSGYTMIDDESKEVKNNYYPTPVYNSGITSIRSSIEVNHFNYSELINGFKGGTLISLNNGYILDEHERRKTEAYIKEGATSRNKQGGIVVLYSDGKERAPTIEPLNGNDLPTRYLMLREALVEDILVAHSITSPIIVGIQVQGKLGNSSEYPIAWEVFMNDYIKPRRSQIQDFFKQLGLVVDFVDETPTFLKPQQFSAIQDDEEERILNEFAKCGKEILNGEIIEEKAFCAHSKQRFNDNLSDAQFKILNLILSGEKLGGIAVALQISLTELLGEINYLRKLGYIDDEFKLTKKGSNVAKEAKYVVRTYYQYRVRPGLGEPIIEGTRKFCKKMIQMGKYYTREEIDKISERVGRDVWYYRGGFYNNGQVTTPNCRHTWWQIIVREEL